MSFKYKEVNTEFTKRGSSEHLIIILHAFNNNPSALRSVVDVVKNSNEHADLLVPSMPLQWYSFADATDVVVNIVRKIDKLWQDNKYKKIIFIGHSFGALLARKAYVYSCGHVEANFEIKNDFDKKRDWSKKVERIILFTGMNRGWKLSHHLSIKNYIVFGIGSGIGSFLSVFKRNLPIISSIKRGAPFITQLRIHWIDMRNNVAKAQVGDALTIQLLGSIDDLVSPDDNLDLVSGKDFVYLDMPYSGHQDVIHLDEPTELPVINNHKDNITTIGEARKAVFLSALTENKEDLLKASYFPSDIEPLEKKNDVTDVVFIIHGIRDLGHWTNKIARRIRASSRQEGYLQKKVVIATKTASYGYFPMLPFILPSKRREKVEWFMDQYAESKAKYPNADFSFVGHSNGTYLLARALKEYPACSFKHVVFAGSVVATNYGWTKVFKNGQVQKVLNFVSTADWVVAIFPKAVQMLKIQDLGSAGHDGFDQDITQSLNVENKKFVTGSHSAALDETNWNSITRFILKGEIQDLPDAIKSDKPSLLIKIVGILSPLLLALAVGIVGFIYWQIWHSSFTDIQSSIITVAYSVVLWKILTRL